MLPMPQEVQGYAQSDVDSQIFIMYLNFAFGLVLLYVAVPNGGRRTRRAAQPLEVGAGEALDSPRAAEAATRHWPTPFRTTRCWAS